MTLLDARPSTTPQKTPPPKPTLNAKTEVGEQAQSGHTNTPTRDRAGDKLRLLQITLRATVVITVAIAGGSFFLSFWSLWDLASRLGRVRDAV